MEVRSFEAIVRALNGAKVDYLIVGGMAVNAHGFVRLTRDVDIVIGLEPENARRGLNALIAIGYQLAIPEEPAAFADAPTRERWRVEKNMIVLKLWSDNHQRTPVDIFVYEPFAFAEEHEKCLLQEISPGVDAKIVSLEALLEMKKTAGRVQDLNDIEELTRAR